MDQISNELQTALGGCLEDLILESANVEEFLAQLATMAAASLSSSGRRAVQCSVVLRRPKKSVAVGTSGGCARAMGELHVTLRGGPCLSAARENQSVLVPDLRTERRWPDYVRAASSQGIRSILSVPLIAEGETSAVLNLYSSSSASFGEDHIQEAQSFAARVSKPLLLALRIAHLVDLRDNLRAAMQSRTPINLAAGMVMAQNRCSQEAAMATLKAASSHRNTKLRDLAQALIFSVTSQTAVSTHFEE